MIDSTFPTDRPTESVCPWCSASVTPETTICPSCGAILISDEEPDLPGVTAVDQAISRGERKPAGRGRLLSWISGEFPDDTPSVADTQALAPPEPEVQREILRLALEAEVANLQAEADAILSEAVVEGRVADLPDGVRPFATSEPASEAPAAEAEEDDTPTADDDDTPTADDDAPPADGKAPADGETLPA